MNRRTLLLALAVILALVAYLGTRQNRRSQVTMNGGDMTVETDSPSGGKGIGSTLPRFVPPPADPGTVPSAAGTDASAAGGSTGSPDANERGPAPQMVKNVLPKALMGQGSKTLKNFDRQVQKVFVYHDRDRLLTFGGGTGKCGLEYLSRLKHDRWHLSSNVLVHARIADQIMAIEQFDLLEEDPQRTGDREFKQCFQAAVSTLRIECPGCRSGAVTFNWTFSKVYEVGVDPTESLPPVSAGL